MIYAQNLLYQDVNYFLHYATRWPWRCLIWRMDCVIRPLRPTRLGCRRNAIMSVVDLSPLCDLDLDGPCAFEALGDKRQAALPVWTVTDGVCTSTDIEHKTTHLRKVEVLDWKCWQVFVANYNTRFAQQIVTLQLKPTDSFTTVSKRPRVTHITYKIMLHKTQCLSCWICTKENSNLSGLSQPWYLHTEHDAICREKSGRKRQKQKTDRFAYLTISKSSGIHFPCNANTV